MQLRRLTGIERGKIEKEYAETTEKIALYKRILADRQLVLNLIKEELTAIREKYADARRTRIEGAVDMELSAKDLIPNEPMAVFITNQGYIKRLPLDTFKRQR